MCQHISLYSIFKITFVNITINIVRNVFQSTGKLLVDYKFSKVILGNIGEFKFSKILNFP